MIFVDFKDKNRRYYDIRDKEIDKILKKNRPNLAIPMPAVGEVYFKMRHNPQKDLCDTFWEILKKTILTQK